MNTDIIKGQGSASQERTTRVDGNFRVLAPANPMSFTGERLTSVASGQIEFEHYHRYCFARDLCDNLDVLDVASGEGYGTAILAGVARQVTGVDVDAEAVEHARNNYSLENMRFLEGSVLALPLPDASFDVVVSFETLEHVSDHHLYMSEIKRVLRPGGLLIVSTPDRSVYSAFGVPPNPFHCLELTAPELRARLESTFSQVRILAQRPFIGSVMASDEGTGWRTYERRDTNIIEATSGFARAHYLIGLASDKALPNIPSSAYIGLERVNRAEELAAEHRSALAEYQSVVDERGEKIAELTRQIDALQSQLSQSMDCSSSLVEYQAVVDERGQKIAELTAKIEALRSQLTQSIESAQRESATKVEAEATIGALGAASASLAQRLMVAETEAKSRTQQLELLGIQLAAAEQAERAHLATLSSGKIFHPGYRTALATWPDRTLPQALRTPARRLMKLAWWTLSLQLAQRLRARNDRQKNLSS